MRRRQPFPQSSSWICEVQGQGDNAVERLATFPHSPETVWRALTEKAKISRWLHPATDDIKPIVGHRFALVPGGGASTAERIECCVVAADAGRRLCYTWQPSGEKPSMVTWLLEPIDGGGGTRVHLRHDGALPGSVIPLLSAALADHASSLRRRGFRGLAIGRQVQGALLCR
jgi:uncharacterized protein YndB with AHSA1/START domain